MTDRELASMTGGTDVLTWILSAFAGIALVVTVLVVANTFSVILSQRTRELALLRTLGARRSQIRRMVLGEAIIVGLLGGLAGLVLGTGVVAGGVWLIQTLFGLSYVTFGFTWAAVIIGISVGLLATMLAAMRPALAATKVSPLAALRPAETITLRSKVGITRVVIGSLLVVLGASALLYSVLPKATDASSFGLSFGMAFLGGLASFVGVLVLGTLLIPWAVRQLSRPFSKNLPGRLAGLNALRHPARTSAIGTALLLGVTLVSLMLAGATSARSTINSQLAQQYPVDLIIYGEDSSALARDTQQAVADVSGVTATAYVKPVALTEGCAETHDSQRRSTDPSPKCAYVVASSEKDLTRTSTDGARVPARGSIAVGKFALGQADQKDLPARIRLTDGNGHTSDVPIDAAATAPAGQLLMSDETRQKIGFQAQLETSKVPEKIRRAATAPQLWIKADASASVGPLMSQIATAAKVDQNNLSGALPTRQATSQVIDTLLMVVSALLAIAVIIALIGVSNTLSLSVTERTRENSLLRALGLTKKQLRRMLALEAALIAAAATVLGITLGTAYGLAGARAATSSISSGFVPDLPWLWLAIVIAASVGAAVLASVWPARRATRLSPVEGLANE